MGPDLGRPPKTYYLAPPGNELPIVGLYTGRILCVPAGLFYLK